MKFALAADILRMAVAPSWQDTGQLNATAELRMEIHLCSPGQFRLASSMCLGIASDQVFFTPLL